MSTGSSICRAIAGVIRSAEPDLVALQEVDQDTHRTGGVDQPAELARRTGLHVAFGSNLSYEGGGYGNAVLSRLPIKRHRNHAIPSFDDGEQRGVLEAEVELPGGQRLVLLATHLDHRGDDHERVASAEFIARLAAAHPQLPLLLAGDLNDTPGSTTMRVIEQTWSLPPGEPLATIPSARPLRQIDYVLFRPAGRWKAVELRVLDEPVASDHRPLLAVLELLPAAAD